MQPPVEIPIGALTAAVGMTTARWMSLPVEVVDIASLTPVQAEALDLWPDARTSAHTSGDPCIHVVELAGVRWLEDGHHRLAKTLRRGETQIAARVLRVTFRGVAA